MSNIEDHRKDIIGKKELARRLNRNVRTISTWMASGRISYYRLGPRAVYFDFNEVLKAVKN